MTKAVKYSLRKSDGIIGVSKEVISKIQSLNKPKVILPMGVDLSKFKPIPKQEACNQLGLSPEKKYIFFPSNPERPVKNFTLAKLAFDLLTREDVNLLIAKNIPPDKMWLYYNAADIVLVTSFHEGSPNVIKEAMACNTPIISVNVGDVSERFRNSIYGNSVVPYDPYKMAEQMEHYLQSEKRSDGRKIVSEISEDKIIEMSILFFESIVKSYNNRPSF
jgi:glycosyltransferase involved in cell wall biosynthesis